MTLPALLLGAGCTTPIEGAKDVPPGWAPDGFSAHCELLAGTYSEAGEPAPANSQPWLYNWIWPANGALSAILERGSNGNTSQRYSGVTVHIDPTGIASFVPLGVAGEVASFRPRQWGCENGMLTSQVALGDDSDMDSAHAPHRDSYMRLWKNSEGALIAEQTIRTVKNGSLTARGHYTPLVRFYFRFAARPAEG